MLVRTASNAQPKEMVTASMKFEGTEMRTVKKMLGSCSDHCMVVSSMNENSENKFENKPIVSYCLIQRNKKVHLL